MPLPTASAKSYGFHIYIRSRDSCQSKQQEIPSHCASLDLTINLQYLFGNLLDSDITF